MAAGNGLHPNQPLCRIGLTMSAASLAQLLALYVAIGLCTAVAFVTIGIRQVLAQPASFTIGARLLLLPGAAALWPYVLYRWVRAHQHRARVR